MTPCLRLWPASTRNGACADAWVQVLREDQDSPPEGLLQTIWQHQRLRRDQLKTLDGQPLRILHPGFRNVEGGPDFCGALVQVGDSRRGGPPHQGRLCGGVAESAPRRSRSDLPDPFWAGDDPAGAGIVSAVPGVAFCSRSCVGLESSRECLGSRGTVMTRMGVEGLPNQLFAEAQRHGLAQAARVLVVADGALWIWSLSHDRSPQAYQRLDYYHAAQHLWAVARWNRPVGNTNAVSSGQVSSGAVPATKP
jgi:hypothetical protein